MANETKKDDKLNQGTQKRADEAGQAVADTVAGAASSAVATADKAAETAGHGMRSAAGTVRQNAPREGMLGAASETVANTLDQAGEYLEKEGVSGAAKDFYAVIQRYPITSAILGVALGYLAACAMSRSSS